MSISTLYFNVTNQNYTCYRNHNDEFVKSYSYSKMIRRRRRILERDLTDHNLFHTKPFNISIQRLGELGGMLVVLFGSWDGNNNKTITQ